MSGFTFVPAVRERVSLLIALAGASGSGKTMSALLLAQGMSPEGRIAFIDTEARRGLHYADSFRFMHTDMRPQFRPERFVEAIHAAEDAGAEVVIVDSFSHEYDGEGGILDWAADLERGGENGDGAVKPPGNWKVPKLAHKRMMNAILQCRASLIFCLRADEKIEIAKEEVEGRNGQKYMKTVVRPLGWMPICEKRFMFEMTASFTLRPDAPGIPQFDLAHKLQAQHRPMFPEGQHISREAGRLLAEWARGDNVVSQDDRLAELVAAGDAASADGAVALGQWGASLSAADKKLLGTERREAWKRRAAEARDPETATP